MNRFENKVALVTGGAMGLGAEVARRLAGEGARIVIVDIDAAKGKEVAAALPGEGHVVLEADLRDEASIEDLARRVAEAVGGLDVLVNNAGISRPEQLADVTEDNWRAQVAINLKAPMLLTKALFPLMRDRSAAVVNISSERGFNTSAGSVVYDITKAAIGGLTRSSAAELWEHGIRVNELAPGGMVTEMHFGGAPDPEARKRELEEIRLPEMSIMGRLAHPAEVAAAVAFLASSDASFMTGTTLHVDGGMGVR